MEEQVGMLQRKAVGLEVVGVLVEQQLGLGKQERQIQQQGPASPFPGAPSPAAPLSDALVCTEISRQFKAQKCSTCGENATAFK